MKKVVRWQCSFCQKTAAKPETMAAHERECIRNPESRNCYMCERAVLGGYRQGYGGEYWDESMAFCSYHMEPLDLLRAQGYKATNCEDFVRSNELYKYREGEK